MHVARAPAEVPSTVCSRSCEPSDTPAHDDDLRNCRSQSPGRVGDLFSNQFLRVHVSMPSTFGHLLPTPGEGIQTLAFLPPGTGARRADEGHHNLLYARRSLHRSERYSNRIADNDRPCRRMPGRQIPSPGTHGDGTDSMTRTNRHHPRCDRSIRLRIVVQPALSRSTLLSSRR
jgi:hypothetical protein